MKSIVLLCLAVSIVSMGQAPKPVNATGGELESVLSQMDSSASTFKSVQAQFEWDNYQKVVDETEKQTGQVYFRRNGPSVQVMFDIAAPAPKQILFKDNKLWLYEKRPDQVTEHDAGNKSDIEGYLSLGFGARGHELIKNYDVKMDGWETVDGVKTAKLELVAKSEKVRNMFSHFIIWIDAQRDVPIKQQVFASSGDYWLAHYISSSIKRNVSIPDTAFKLETTPHTRTVKPQ
jgi:outer membrane lipoprotein-sorting protein